MERNIKINKCIHDRDNSFEVVCYNNEYNKDNSVVMYCANIIVLPDRIFLYNKHREYIGFINAKAVINIGELRLKYETDIPQE